MNLVELGDICTMKYGKMLPEDMAADEGFPVYSGYRITGYSREFIYKEPMLLVVARGVGGTGDVKIAPPNAWITNLSIVLELDDSKVNKKYLCYLLNRESLKDKLNSGAAQAQITIDSLSKYRVQLPELGQQIKIADFIESYDDLIENNRRRIQLLEESARLLYQEWFVHLRFPSHEQVKITDGVPEGWSCSPVDSLLGKVQKKKKVKKEEYLEAGLIPCIDQSQDFIGGYIDDEEAAITENLPIVVFGDHTRIVKFIDFPFAPGADGTQLLIPNDDEMPREFFYFMISSINVANAFYARHFKFLKTTNVLVPEKRLMIDFSTFVGDNMRQIKLLRNQNRSLAQARDLLLPKLMCGELTV